MSYVDGFVLAVPKANKQAYLESAQKSWALFKEFGAIRHVECWGDEVPEGKVTDFQGAVKAKEDEIIVFAWVEYPSKEVRDAAGKKMMEDPRMEELMGKNVPFDGMRMIYGGFIPIHDQSA